MKKENPCCNCRERFPGCHETCKKGIEEERARAERKEIIWKAKKEDAGYAGYKRETVEGRVCKKK